MTKGKGGMYCTLEIKLRMSRDRRPRTYEQIKLATAAWLNEVGGSSGEGEAWREMVG